MMRTERLILRAAQQKDLEDLFRMHSDPDAMAYWSTAPHSARSETQAILDKLIAAAKKRLVYFVFEKDGEAIGFGGMHKEFEIGFMLSQAYWRQGFVSEAMNTIIPYLFEETGAPYLTADADPNNAASVGLLKHLGFHETHRAKNTFCINGVWSNSVYFRLDKPS